MSSRKLDVIAINPNLAPFKSHHSKILLALALREAAMQIPLNPAQETLGQNPSEFDESLILNEKE
jgi:hypothetical protein